MLSGSGVESARMRTRRCLRAFLAAVAQVSEQYLRA
jgi:hypothetical protein